MANNNKTQEGNIGIDGFRDRSLDSIKQSIIRDIENQIPDFKNLDRTLVSNLIDTGSVLLKQVEGISKFLFNGISLPSVTDEFFDLVSRDYGMNRHQAAKAQLDITIEGTPGFIIESGTSFVSTKQNLQNIVFYNIEDVIINSIGSVTVRCVSDSLPEQLNEVKVNDIDRLALANNNVTSVKNINIPTPRRDIESLQNFKFRIQERLRNPIQGSYEGLLSSLKEIPDVDPLLVNVNIGSQMIDSIKYNGIEAIVGGGDPAQISKVLLDYCGLSPRLLISNPSKSETNRTITQSVTMGSSNFEVKFTRPKLLNFELTMKPRFKNVTATSQQLEIAITDKMIDIFNNLAIHDTINKTFIKDKFISLLSEYGITLQNIIDVDFEYKIDGAAGQLDSQGFISEKLSDTYLKIVNFKIIIQG